MNRSEQFVFDLCAKSFLSLWSYPTPRGKNAGKELCDILVVCDPDIIIFSVKEIELKEGSDISVDWNRWQRKAIDESCEQIYGAERWINSAQNVITQKGEASLPFPDVSRRRIHRVAVALGGNRKVPFHSGDFGKGLVHVFDEESLKIIMSELDTITDFIKYFDDKERFYCGGKGKIIVAEGEENLLALYLLNNRTFPTDADCIMLDDSYWKSFASGKHFLAKKEADKASYAWDRLIETLCNDFRNQDLLSEFPFSATLTDVELVVRTMARENRFSRRLLGAKFAEFLESKSIRSRTFGSLSGVHYVFLFSRPGFAGKYRLAELGGRCFVVRGLNPACKLVIGISTELPDPEKKFLFEIMYMHKPDWTVEDQRELEFVQKEFGWFSNATQSRMKADEYPSA